MYYIDLSSEGYSRYDMAKFMAFDGIYEEPTSYFIQQLVNLPVGGNYEISVACRPDIYAMDIYHNVSHWQVLLTYNKIVDIKHLIVGKILSYPSLNDLENTYFRLKALQKAQDS